MGYPEPKTGGPKKPSTAYPEPTGGAINKGLDSTSHNGSNYPQPNSANQTGTPGIAPGADAYQPNLAGNSPGAVTTGTPGLNPSGNAGDGAQKG